MRYLAHSDVPAKLAALGEAATECGWLVVYTRADGPPATIAFRVSRDHRLGYDARRGYGIWRVDDGLRWTGGASNGFKHFRTLADFKAWLGVQ